MKVLILYTVTLNIIICRPYSSAGLIRYFKVKRLSVLFIQICSKWWHLYIPYSECGGRNRFLLYIVNRLPEFPFICRGYVFQKTAGVTDTYVFAQLPQAGRPGREFAEAFRPSGHISSQWYWGGNIQDKSRDDFTVHWFSSVRSLFVFGVVCWPLVHRLSFFV